MNQNCKACRYARAIPLQPGHLQCMQSPPQMVIVGQGGQMAPLRPVVAPEDFCAHFAASGAGSSLTLN